MRKISRAEDNYNDINFNNISLAVRATDDVEAPEVESVNERRVKESEDDELRRQRSRQDRIPPRERCRTCSGVGKLWRSTGSLDCDDCKGTGKSSESSDSQ